MVSNALANGLRTFSSRFGMASRCKTTRQASSSMKQQAFASSFSTYAFSAVPALRTSAAERTSQVCGKSLDRNLQYRCASSASVDSTYFSPNLPRLGTVSSIDTEGYRRKRTGEDIEESWRWAQRSEDGSLSLEQKACLARKTDGVATSRAEQARAANAALSLDDAQEDARETPTGLGYRDLILRCTTLDSLGSIQKNSEPVAKSSLCTQHGLQPRDLRKIDSRIPNVVPTILVRKEAILLNMLHIRLLIKANTVMLFDGLGTTDSALLQSFVRDLSRGLKQGYRASGGLPYEFRALEAALSSVSSALEEEMGVHRDAVERLIGPLESHIVPSELRKLLQYSRQLQAFQKRARNVQAAIDEVLEQDDDLSAMYLSEGLVKPRSTDDHQEIEMLLESFSKQVEEIVNEVDSLVTNVHQTQDVIELILDASRNSLLTLDLQASIATMGLASGAFIAGLFGMNLHSSMEMTPHAFWITTAAAGGLVAVVTIGGLRRVTRLRRIGLGHGVFGDYNPANQNKGLTGEAQGSKASYYERSTRKRRDKQDREYARFMHQKTAHAKPINYEGYH